MENSIKSSLINTDNLKSFLNDEPIDAINTNFDNISCSSNNKSINDSIEKAKELIEKLLKESLDQRISTLDKNSSKQLNIIKNSKDLANAVTNMTLRISKQIQEKIKKDKEKQNKLKQNKVNKFKKGYSPHKSAVGKNTSSNFYRSKTPSHIGKSNNNNIHSKTPLVKLKKDLSKSKSNVTLGKKNLTRNNGKYNIRRKSLGRKTKSSLNFKNFKNINDNSVDDLQTISVTSIKTNKTNNLTINPIKSKINNYKNFNKTYRKKTNLRQNLDVSKDSKTSSSRKKINLTTNNINISSDKNLIANLNKKKVMQKNPNINNNNSEINNSDEKNMKRKKTPFKKPVIEYNIKNKGGERTIEDEIDDILKLQKENILNDNDPLLILPLKDLDFVPKGILRRNSIRSDMRSSRRYKINNFDILQNIDETKFNIYIFLFLDINTLINLKNVSKKFHKLVIPYIVKLLKEEKNKLLEIKLSLDFTTTPERESIENIVLSKSTKKATQLLNESLLNHLFKDNKFPSDDIILIYRIYFQLINHPYSKIAKSDIFKFWEKCKLYFTSEQNGKTGDILLSIINNKTIDFSKNNLYQIYMLTKDNYKKIFPNYFSNICGTTGLFVFVIKDILEFMGLTPKIKKKENAFWTYSDIIESIDDKINYLGKS
jgi:hypothetical protein